MLVSWPMAVLVWRWANVGVPSALDPDTVPGSTAVAERPEEAAAMAKPVDLEPQAKAVADANADSSVLV